MDLRMNMLIAREHFAELRDAAEERRRYGDGFPDAGRGRVGRALRRLHIG